MKALIIALITVAALSTQALAQGGYRFCWGCRSVVAKPVPTPTVAIQPKH